jgi:transposase
MKIFAYFKIETPFFLVIPGFLRYNTSMNMTMTVPELQQQNKSLTARVTEQAALIEKLEALNKYYESQLLALKRRQFGSSSEKTEVDYRQMNLWGENETQAPLEPETEEITYSRKKRKGKREEDLSGLPVERVDYELPENERGCPECGKVMHDIGVDVRRELKLIPARVVVAEHAAHTYACGNCRENSDGTPIIKAGSPKSLISGSLASPSLVAHIAYQKYSNCTPLYRLEKGFEYDGVVISRQTMANWVIKCSEIYLAAIYEALKTHLLEESVLHADETTVQVLREPGRDPKSKSYEWVYRSSGCSEKKIVVFDYQETRKQERPQEFLKRFKGFLHTDGYQAYHNLPSDITVVGCWAHVRRKWESLLKTIHKNKRPGSDAENGLMRINKLFSLEREFKSLSPDERYEKRLEKSKPLAEAFFAWVDNLDALPKMPLGEAAHYALSQR